MPTPPSAPSPELQPLRWPPPGLEPLHARLWPIVAGLLLADAVLVLPLLWSVATDWEFSSFGPFGAGWWVVIATSAVGLILFIAALERLVRLCLQAAKAGDLGHRWMTVVLTTTDVPRDTGFALQGERHYAGTQAAMRNTVLVTRVLSLAAFLLAALWLPFAFGLSVPLAARGVFGPGAVRIVTLVVPLVLLAGGLGGRWLDYRIRRASARGPRAKESTGELRDEIKLWSTALEQARGGVTLGAHSAPISRGFRWVGGVVTVLGILVLLVGGSLAFAGGIGPILASLAMPSFDRTQARIVMAGAFRRFRTAPDPAVTAEAAGEALHALAWMHPDETTAPFQRSPVRGYPEPWVPEGLDSVAQGPLGRWAVELFDRDRGDLSPAEREYLRRIAAHPAHGEWETAGRAAAADILGTRFILPLPDSISPVDLPLPHFAAFRTGASAHLARAALAFHDDRIPAAERGVQDVLSAGYILIDDGPTVFDDVIGVRLVEDAAEALGHLYRRTGRQTDGEAIAWMRQTARAVRQQTPRVMSGLGVTRAMRVMPDLVLDSTLARGLRWDLLLMTATFAPCSNLNEIVFGPGEGYDAWLAEARTALVRRPSDEFWFAFLRRGWFGPDVSTGGGPVNWVLAVTFGGRRPASICGWAALR